MVKIAFLQSMKQTKRIFSDRQIDRIKSFGDFCKNEHDELSDAALVKNVIKDADVAVTSWGCPELSKEILDAAPKLKAVLHAAGSVKGIVSDELIKKGVRVTCAAKVLGQGVAETALGLTISSLKNIWVLSRNTKAGEWAKDRDRCREVYDVKIGVIGAGNAGRHYIKLVRNFDVEVLLYDPFVDEKEAAMLGVVKSELEELLAVSDVVSLHAPSIPETYRMINRERLSTMKDNAIIINTARGSLIDENALSAELQKGRLFACLDVTDPEPPSPGHPFRALPNVVMTPHIAGLTNNGVFKIGSYIADELERFINGQKMDGEIDLLKLNIMA